MGEKIKTDGDWVQAKSGNGYVANWAYVRLWIAQDKDGCGVSAIWALPPYHPPEGYTAAEANEQMRCAKELLNEIITTRGLDDVLSHHPRQIIFWYAQRERRWYPAHHFVRWAPGKLCEKCRVRRHRVEYATCYPCGTWKKADLHSE